MRSDATLSFGHVFGHVSGVILSTCQVVFQLTYDADIHVVQDYTECLLSHQLDPLVNIITIQRSMSFFYRREVLKHERCIIEEIMWIRHPCTNTVMKFGIVFICIHDRDTRIVYHGHDGKGNI